MSNSILNIPAFILGINEELEKNAKKKKRCWQGYEPVPGKKPYSEDSCRPVSSEKKAAQYPLLNTTPQTTLSSGGAMQGTHLPINIQTSTMGQTTPVNLTAKNKALGKAVVNFGRNTLSDAAELFGPGLVREGFGLVRKGFGLGRKAFPRMFPSAPPALPSASPAPAPTRWSKIKDGAKEFGKNTLAYSLIPDFSDRKMPNFEGLSPEAANEQRKALMGFNQIKDLGLYFPNPYTIGLSGATRMMHNIANAGDVYEDYMKPFEAPPSMGRVPMRPEYQVEAPLPSNSIQVTPQNQNTSPQFQKASVDLSSMPINENILPSLSSQVKWKYSRTPNALKLSDGNSVFSFGLPKDFPDEDTPIERLADDNLTDFEKDVLSQGTAQIHRSSPDNIYLTLNDGSQNPTFMLQHEKDKQWRYSPSKKFIEKLKKIKESLPAGMPEEVPVDPAALLESTQEISKEANFTAAATGAAGHAAAQYGFSQQEIAEHLNNLAQGTISFGNKAIDFMANHPLESAFGGYIAAQGLKKLYNLFNRDSESSSLPVGTAATLGIAPVIAAKYIRGKYK